MKENHHKGTLMTELESRRVFLIATESPKTNSQIEGIIKAKVPKSMVYSAVDGLEALFKFENVPPHVVILDSRLPKVSAFELTEKFIHRKERAAVIVLCPTEMPEKFMDEVATGQVQFLSTSDTDSKFHSHINRAMNWVVDGNTALYRLRFLSANELLLKEGQPGEHVYLVKSGEMKAFKRSAQDEEILLGYVKAGEFVGEMAYINGEPRSANVIATTDCELIEISSSSLDAVLFSKPAWSKALMKTLSKRLKVYNDVKS
jgi:DNA-binding NarL/FixJ family response regulator